MLPLELLDRCLRIRNLRIQILARATTFREISDVSDINSHLEAAIRGGDLGLHLLDPALELILVAELVPAFTLVQLQPMEISLVLS